MMERVLPPGNHCWALALGGTRRAYLACGGTLASDSDLDAYFSWVDAQHCALLGRLYDFGVRTVIAIGRVPADRGAAYTLFSQRTNESLINGAVRRAFYAARDLQVSVAGDLADLEAYLGLTGFAAACQNLRQTTACGQGGQLIYLFRGSWVDAAEEAAWGYRLGYTLGRAPARDELVRAFYGLDVPPLTVYVGSGQPRIGLLRPPFLSGYEDCYWAANCPIRLNDALWACLIDDHLNARPTKSARDYPSDPVNMAQLRADLAVADDQILGIGRRTRFGFWLADTEPMEHHSMKEICS